MTLKGGGVMSLNINLILRALHTYKEIFSVYLIRLLGNV